MEPYHILLPNIHNKLKYRIKCMQYKIKLFLHYKVKVFSCGTKIKRLQTIKYVVSVIKRI